MLLIFGDLYEQTYTEKDWQNKPCSALDAFNCLCTWWKWLPPGDVLWYHVDIVFQRPRILWEKERGCVCLWLSDFPKLIKLEPHVLFFSDLKIMLVVHLAKKNLPNKSGSNSWINDCSKTHEFSILYLVLLSTLKDQFSLLFFFFFFAGNCMV